MSILYPAAIGKPNTYVCFTRGTIGYTQNGPLDRDQDGVITKFEGASGVRDALSRGRRTGFFG